MSEKQYWWSHRKRVLTSSQRRKMIRQLNHSYALGEKIHDIAELNRKTEQEQAEEELATRLSIL